MWRLSFLIHFAFAGNNTLRFRKYHTSAFSSIDEVHVLNRWNATATNLSEGNGRSARTNGKYTRRLTPVIPESGKSPQSCPGTIVPIADGFYAPKKYGDNLRMSDGPAVTIAHMVDHIYILCVKNCQTVRSRLPSTWPLNKTSLFNGVVYDTCVFNSTSYGHWLQASFSHMAIILDAMEHGYTFHMVLEDDIVFFDDIHWPDCRGAAFHKLLRSDDWWSIKLGYNMGGPKSCPRGCECRLTQETWCPIPPDSKCHQLIGLSHHYILSSRAYNTWLDFGAKIDVVGRSHRGIILLVPMLSGQKGKLIPHALKSQDIFIHSCVNESNDK